MGATMNPVQARLLADRDRLRALADAHPEAIRVVQEVGNPPTGYDIELRCRGVEDLGPKGPILRASHLVRVRLPASYPIKQPTVQVLTPVRNPHIFPSQMICLGSEWSPGQSLDLFVRRIWRILVWDPAVIDPKSPADLESLAWYEAHRAAVPFDRIDPVAAPSAPAAPKPRIAWNG